MARSTLPPPVEVPDGYGVLRLEAMWTPPEHAAAFAAARMPEVWPVSCPSPPLYCCWPSNVRSRRCFSHPPLLVLTTDVSFYLTRTVRLSPHYQTDCNARLRSA